MFYCHVATTIFSKYINFKLYWAISTLIHKTKTVGYNKKFVSDDLLFRNENKTEEEVMDGVYKKEK